MRGKKVLILIIVIILGLMAIFLRFHFPIRIVHKPLSGEINLVPFLDAGCKIEESRRENYLNCSFANLENKFRCERIYPAPKYLVGLKVPIVKCTFTNYTEASDVGYLYKEGCMAPIFIRYIVFDGKDFILLKTKEEFKKFFSPIDTSEEALSYASAITGSYPEYGFLKVGGKYMVTTIEDSYVKKVDSNYIVHLYNYELCGCGTHPYYTVDYLVSADGNVSELQRQNIWELPYVVCID